MNRHVDKRYEAELQHYIGCTLREFCEKEPERFIYLGAYSLAFYIGKAGELFDYIDRITERKLAKCNRSYDSAVRNLFFFDTKTIPAKRSEIAEKANEIKQFEVLKLAVERRINQKGKVYADAEDANELSDLEDKIFEAKFDLSGLEIELELLEKKRKKNETLRDKLLAHNTNFVPYLDRKITHIWDRDIEPPYGKWVRVEGDLFDAGDFWFHSEFKEWAENGKEFDSGLDEDF